MDAESREVVRGSGIGVASVTGTPRTEKELGETTHPRAGDADEVNGSFVRRVDQGHVRNLDAG